MINLAIKGVIFLICAQLIFIVWMPRPSKVKWLDWLIKIGATIGLILIILGLGQ